MSNSNPTKERALDRMPLRVRLVLLLGVLLVVALGVTSLTTLTLLKRSLIAQVDDNLRSAIHLLEARGSWPSNAPTSDLPSNYYMRVLAPDGSTYLDAPATTGTDSVPEIPSITYQEMLQAAGQIHTVGSVQGNSTWRMVFVRGVDQYNTPVTVAIALPLDAVQDTLAQMQLFIGLVGVGVVLVAVIAGYAAVQRSLRGLRAIEDTAAEVVASGDLTRRAPVAPDSTEVGRLGTSFNAMVANLETAFAAQAASEARMRRFVSDASHELRTPLASIRGYGELYRMGAVPEEQLTSTFGRIESEAIRMSTLVNDLLALARLDEGKQELRLTWVNLTAIARDALDDLRALDSTRPSEVIADDEVWVEADADRIRQVVTNLIGNAIQHTPEGTAVEIAVGAPQGWAALEVRDHGPGVPPEAADRIFERFYRPDTSRARSSGGSGLGLAIVATIVAAHGGTTNYRPTPGGGATLAIYLPLSRSGAEADPAAETGSQDDPATGD